MMCAPLQKAAGLGANCTVFGSHSQDVQAEERAAIICPRWPLLRQKQLLQINELVADDLLAR